MDQAQAANTSEVTRAIVAQDNLNISDVIWQQACIKMITSQENHPQQKQLVALFWQNLENLYSLRYPGESPSRPDYTEGQDEAHALKYGILGPLTTKYVLDAMGVSSTLPKSRDDAIHKVDLISEATSKSGKKYAAVIQIKTSQLGLGDIRCEEINHLVPENLPSLYARQEARARNRLFRFAQDLSRKTKMQAVPLWAEIKGEKDSPDIDDITGRPNQAFINRHLGGQFGQTIKKVLNIP